MKLIKMMVLRFSQMNVDRNDMDNLTDKNDGSGNRIMTFEQQFLGYLADTYFAS